MSVEENKALVRRFVEEFWNEGNMAATDDVQDSVKDLAHGMYSGSFRGFRGRDMGFYAGPLGIGEVGRVRLSHTC